MAYQYRHYNMQNMEALKKLAALKKKRPDVREVVSKCLQRMQIKNYSLPDVSERHRKYIREEIDNMPDECMTFDISMEITLMNAGDRNFQMQTILKNIKKKKGAEVKSSHQKNQIQWIDEVNMQNVVIG